VVTTVGSLLLGLLRHAPTELEIVGSEDFGGGFLSPIPLTLVQADAGELARHAADVLAARIEGTLADEPVTKLLPTTLVEYRRTPGAIS
jgi:DNA-binding LacI/PurR family transcriptional regulator